MLIQADANDGQWTGTSGSEPWQPLAWMGSAYRAVTDPSVRFSYAVNPFMVGNLADIPFDGQSAILARGHRGRGCAYVGDRHFLAGQDQPGFRADAGLKPQFLALAPWVIPVAGRAHLRSVGAAVGAGSSAHHYVQTALIADLPFPADSPAARLPGGRTMSAVSRREALVGAAGATARASGPSRRCAGPLAPRPHTGSMSWSSARGWPG